MNTAVISTKIEPQIKRQAQKTAKELGIPLSVVIKAFLKHFIRTKSIEFSARNEEPSEYLKSVIRQAEENLKQGKHSPIFKTGKEAVTWLEKQGI
ncbi:type II toxin-antitoxin system RelB/DinJ family antitoxin [Candidatus Gottesmanbacteria bacterium]|nr:type II toxin-antitoxin system RelB/DinJ family antitoxin [Candidatus Gottesmanbacteria bacterium]